MDGNTLTRKPFAFAAALLLFFNSLSARDINSTATPVLLELFTSEGCSSCPPADALLEALDRLQPVSAAEVIVLSEHVDYWNHVGWIDPYSSHQYSDRQQAYANRFRLEAVYTPQMVVDGATEFVGSDALRARTEIEHASQTSKAAVHIALLQSRTSPKHSFRVQVSIDEMPNSARKTGADVYFIVAESHATSQILKGENAGRLLHRVAVVRSLEDIGKVRQGTPFVKEWPVILEAGLNPDNVRVIVFVQEKGQGRVLGAAMKVLA